MVKLHLKRNQFVYFYGERHVNDFEYWTTGKTYHDALRNLRVRIAQTEFFVPHISQWLEIVIDREEIEVIENG